MSFLTGAIGWLWGRKRFFFVTSASTLLFFVWLFPFSDLSDMVTSVISQATGGRIYVQFDRMDLHVVPVPAVSATRVSVEGGFPPLEANYAKLTPGLITTLLNLPTFISASKGDPEAAQKMSSKLSFSVSAEGVFDGDIDVSVGPGKKSEQGRDRSRLALEVDKVNLGEVQRWSELPVKMQGQASFATDLQFSSDMIEQPDGDYDLKIAKFAIPAGTVMVPMEGASLPVNIPNITLANVTFRGRMNNGVLLIEEGVFGQPKDPLFGRIKGQMGLRVNPMGPPTLGTFNLTVELTTNPLIEKELGFVFFALNSTKSPTPGGGGKYLFRAQGDGVGNIPVITRLNTF